MRVFLEFPTDATSAFAHRLTALLNQTLKDDQGLIPEDNSASWYEHLVSSDADGKVNAEAFVLLITPGELTKEGQDKWGAIAESLRSLLNDGDATRSLMKGRATGNPGHSESKISYLGEKSLTL